VQVLAEGEGVLALVDERLLALVPDGEELVRWRGADEAGVDEAREAHPCKALSVSSSQLAHGEGEFGREGGGREGG
jgi:hypothetical protein